MRGFENTSSSLVKKMRGINWRNKNIYLLKYKQRKLSLGRPGVHRLPEIIQTQKIKTRMRAIYHKHCFQELGNYYIVVSIHVLNYNREIN